MPQTIYTDRSRIQTYQRCPRKRWLEYHEGAEARGLAPAKKSIHLVLGGAVHTGLEVLLREGQAAMAMMAGNDLPAKLDNLFVELRGAIQTVARQIENRAVTAALADLHREMCDAGVELDAEEAAQLAVKEGEGQLQPQVDFTGMMPVASAHAAVQDSPITISFDGMGVEVGLSPTIETSNLATPIPAVPVRQTDAEYLRAELTALVEAMVRAYARRRWRPLLEQFEVLEVEREGEWKLGEWSDGNESWNGATNDWNNDSTSYELHFLSRHDALLLERSTGYLYLQSYKTTGSWDRRKELDTQVDMQGLSEAVDVEQRMGEAWDLLHQVDQVDQAIAEDAAKFQLTSVPLMTDSSKRIAKLVTESTSRWLATLPDPPTILGVRYEYLLKGSRKKDDKLGSPTQDRWCQESPLIRAYTQDGITSADRRWAWTFAWHENDTRGGRKSRRLDYRSWRKAPVWQYMAIADWIDQLDRFEVQEGAEREDGNPLDCLAEQFPTVVTQYRNRDEMLDLLEQMDAQETTVAQDVEAVRAAEHAGGYAAKRTELNRRFPQNRQACSWPGVCQYRTTPTQPGFCFGAAGAEHDSMVLERFRVREPNHPGELVQISS